MKNVEKSLQRHLQDVIKDKYLESLVDEDTQLIQEKIPTVLQFLFHAYGKIPSEEVKQKETDLRTTAFKKVTQNGGICQHRVHGESDS